VVDGFGEARVKGVFEVSNNSRYDDFIEKHYHFPRNYLSVAERTVGDWILYRETGAAGGSKAYFAVARVTRIDPDPDLPGHFYARVANYLRMDRPVPYRDPRGRFAERFLREHGDVATVGRALRGRSVRALDGDDFAAIVNAGLDAILDPANAIRLELDLYDLGLDTTSMLGQPLPERRIEQILLNRKFRDAAFRKEVLDAYESTCAVTGMKIINGGGKAEAQAAHIWPVAEGGPDVVQNGIALSATAHWLFDRHLISLDENLGLLVSHNKVPSELLRLFPPSGQPIKLPQDRGSWPRGDYVQRHRERFANKGLW
jgi:putative restriction endonuclease